MESNATLRYLDLSWNKICDVGAQALAQALESNATLQLLELECNKIGDVGAQALAKALESNTTLQVLTLSYNQIGDEGGKALGKALESNPTLQLLDLSCNRITDRVPGWITNLIRRNKRLVEICNSQNLLERTRDVAASMCPIHLPIYVLLEIVEWELALQMAALERDCVDNHFISIASHRRRCEFLERKKRAQMIEFVCTHKKDQF